MAVMYLAILTELGILVKNNDEKIQSFQFDGAGEYADTRSGKARLPELMELLSSIDAPVDTNDGGLLAILKRDSLDARMMDESDIEDIQENKPDILVYSGFASSEHDALQKLRSFALELSSLQVAQVSASADLHLIQTVHSLDEMDKVTNTLFGRLREWYGLHFPELENLVDGMIGYCKIVVAGRRSGMSIETFLDAGFPDTKAEMLALVARTSRGGDISDQNLDTVQEMAKHILAMYRTRGTLEERVKIQMETVAPNLAAIMGYGVAAKMLAHAGSLGRLATMAASTIQVLGAEKALFRSIKTGSRPPKHGIIFQHALVHRAPRWQRGKIARAVASKAVIAARMDVHEPVLNNTLLEKLNIRIGEIEEQYASPPVVRYNDAPSRPRKRQSGGRNKTSKKRKRRFAGR